MDVEITFSEEERLQLLSYIEKRIEEEVKESTKQAYRDLLDYYKEKFDFN